MDINDMIASRRNILKFISAAPVALGAIGSVSPVFSTKAIATTSPAVHLGSITGNDPAGYVRFGQWFGRKPQLALLAFNQSSASALSSSISYVCQQGKAFIANGAQVLWSIPCPGAKQLEEIVAGSYNSLYTNLFQSILAMSPANDQIFVRLPWEFNLSWQENAAIDKNGSFNPSLFIKAWVQIATIARNVSARFIRIWCPNATTMSYDPQTCWPGVNNVDIISQDFYMQSAYNKAGDFSWFLNEARGLQWAADFAHLKGKPYGLSEWGMDSDIFAGDLNSTASWLSDLENAQSSSGFWNNLGGAVHHHCWWDRSDAIDCRISDGTHPGLAAAYKKKFY
jgi:hypothetical protein